MGETNEVSVDLQSLVKQVEADRAALAKLRTQVSALEREVAALKKRADVEIPEDVLLAISAAVSAYLGNKGKIRAVHFHRHRTWAMQGRQAVQSRTSPR
ncbi:hypothetical protein ACFPVT_02155 [Corynebacterium choanae]|uniref:Methylmalonyl-CoA carboxyltransferase 12S subunit n=1 Tax=Corynebacterium choanae TaxID=1862358 RepID=A0A3G6J927_9CORY|nr:hypothetical protein [Corynebacterium choanae]AZA12960.1 Methylmalonyl-CoA carboxyltransferase 12S subunit [Corynebacterium choanae]